MKKLINTGTEEKILNAAKEVFMKYGLYGARMQDIADTAGINKALLHYYFRNKEKLFDKVFEGALQKYFQQMDVFSDSSLPIKERVFNYVDNIIAFLSEYPQMSMFIIKEISINPELFKEKVQESLRRQARAINKHTAKGTYFFDYGNAFLLEASRAGADVMAENNIDFKYPSYVQDIMGPMCFDYGFGPFRWVCTSGKPEDLQKTDNIASQVLEELAKTAPNEIQQQMQDNIKWIKGAQENKLVVGSQARILYADAEGRVKIAEAFNQAIAKGEIGTVVLGRDHHDVSGTDSPYRETSNIYDGSRFTADMAIQNVIGDSFRGATWVSIHNGGGVGWGEVINGGFGMVLDGSKEASKRLASMLFWDVNNGISRRSWARNEGAVFAIKRAMEVEPLLKVTLPNMVDENLF